MLLSMRDRCDQTDFLPSIACPTLIIVGENDAITPSSAATAMKNAIPQATMKTVPQAGHLAPIRLSN